MIWYVYLISMIGWLSLCNAWAPVIKPFYTGTHFFRESRTTRSLQLSDSIIGLNFTAATASDIVDPLVPLSNQNGWVGPQQYILMGYGAIRSFDKYTGAPDGILNIPPSGFFGGIFVQDVRINYSRFLDRWFMCGEIYQSNQSFPSSLIMAWSDSGIITAETQWRTYTFSQEQIAPQASPSDIIGADYVQLATDANAIYMSLDILDTTNTTYLGTTTVVIPNTSFIEGNTFNYTILPGILGPDYPTDSQSEYVPPADNFDKSSQFGYLINAAFNSLDASTGTILSFFRILNPGSSATLSSMISISVPEYAFGGSIGNLYANAQHKGNLFGENGFLQIGVFGGLEAPHVRNKQLYACHPITVDQTGAANPNGDRVAVRWYQFDLTGDATGQGRYDETEATVPALVQWGTLYDNAATDPLCYFIPSIMTNKNHDMIIEGTVSGANAYTNVFAAMRKSTDPAGFLGAPILLTNNTTNPYNLGPLKNPSDDNIGQRWGDESSLCPDPTNDLDIWSTGEWAALYNAWGIQVTQLKPA